MNIEISLVALALLFQAPGAQQDLQKDSNKAAEPKAAAAPVKAPVEAAPRLPSPFERELLAMLDAGLTIGSKNLTAAKERMHTAQQLAPQDPRTDFAFGLVLLKQSQHREAAELFEAAADSRTGNYWPAWQALIWVRLADKQYEAGLRRMILLAQRIRGADPADEVTEREREIARWMGQVVAALDKLITAKKDRDLLSQHQAELLAAIGEELWQSLEEGRDELLSRDLDAAQKAGAAAEKSAKREEQRRTEQVAKLESELAKIDKQKEKAARSVEDWNKWLDQTMAKIDKRLGTLEKDYQFLDRRAQALDQTILQIGRELTALQLTPDQERMGNRAPYLTQREQEVLRRQQQITNYRLEHSQVVSRSMGIAEEAAAVMKQRAQATARFEAATGQIVKKSAELEQWGNRLDSKKKKIEESGAATAAAASSVADPNDPAADNAKGGSSAAGASKGAKTAKAKGKPKSPPRPVITFRTLIPFEPQVEKVRLAQSFEEAPPPAK
jgi:hypothetical protein